jgi:hypothetical protein
MSEPAVFVLIRDGKKSYFGDRWASVFLYREILWGPDEFEKWVTQLEQLDDWTDDVSGGVVVDFDRRKLIWSGDTGQLKIPKVASVYERMLQAAWPGYEIRAEPTGLPALAKAVGIAHAADYDSELGTRLDTIRLAIGRDDDEGDPDDGEGEDAETTDFGDEPFAWVTIIDQGGAVRHRQLIQLPSNLLEGKEGTIDELMRLPAAEVPAESRLEEGMWIDQPRRAIGLWGNHQTREEFEKVQASWRGWTVRWADRGYAEQCQVSGPCVIPMSETEALAQFLPVVLSTKRFDISNVIGTIGGQLKRTAMKATGCLLVAMCFPVLLFGLISGNWRAALITIAIVCAIVVVVFKLLEFKFRRSMAEKTKPLRAAGMDDQKRAIVAGPLDQQERRQRVDQMLLAAGFPPLKSIEPSFPKDNALDLLED